MIANPDFKGMPLFDVEYLRNISGIIIYNVFTSVIRAANRNRRNIGIVLKTHI